MTVILKLKLRPVILSVWNSFSLYFMDIVLYQTKLEYKSATCTLPERYKFCNNVIDCFIDAELSYKIIFFYIGYFNRIYWLWHRMKTKSNKIFLTLQIVLEFTGQNPITHNQRSTHEIIWHNTIFNSHFLLILFHPFNRLVRYYLRSDERIPLFS